MADKKLSSVSAVSDMNFVYAETSTGETVKISKSDLASVVAGLLPVVNRYNNGLVPSVNYGIVSGFNSWVGNNTNQPIADVTSNYFNVLVCVSQYNTAAKLFIVSVGSDKVANASVISGSGSGVSFSVVEGSLCISGAYDKNVSVVILKG